jgi:type I restriction enzyme S subunit
MSENGKNSQLPDAWKRMKLSELGVWVGGGTPSKKDPNFWDSGTIPWVSPKDMKAVVLEATQDHVTQKAVESSAAKLFSANSVAIVVRSGILEHTLPIALVPFEATANQDMRVVTPHAAIDSEWLLYTLLGLSEHLRRTCQKDGTTVASIDVPKLMKRAIAVPPLDEQAQIVQRIKATLDRVSEADDALDLAERRLSLFRQAIIKAVIGGKLSTLSADDAESLVTATRRQLKDLARIQYGWTARSIREPPGTRMLRITDIQDGAVDWEQVPYCQIPDDRRTDYLLSKGDIVFARSGATTGKSFLITAEAPEAVFASYLIRVRVDEALDPGFVALFFQGADYWDYVRKNSRGMAQPNLNGSLLGSLAIPVPPIEVQGTAVAAAHEQLTAISSLSADVERARVRGGALRRRALYSLSHGELSEVAA